MMFYDNGELFWAEGGNVSLARFCSREKWDSLSPVWKAQAIVTVNDVLSELFDRLYPICPFCDERVLPSDRRAPIINMAVHFECGLRNAVGSVGHQRGECWCNKIIDTSEVGMTKREAAKAAMVYHFLHNPHLSARQISAG